MLCHSKNGTEPELLLWHFVEMNRMIDAPGSSSFAIEIYCDGDCS